MDGLSMEILINNYDASINFSNLEEARRYYTPSSQQDDDIKNIDNYLGSESDFNIYILQWEECKKDIQSAKSLKELADVLNRYTDLFFNGSSWSVKEI